MKFTPKNRAQRAAAAGVIALAVLGVSSCSVVNEQATVREYSPSDGIVENVGEIELRNILMVSNGEGEPGRLLGTVINASANTADITLALGGGEVSWTLQAGEKVVFEDAPAAEVTLPNIDVIPGTGLRTDATVISLVSGTNAASSAAAEETLTAVLNIPVVDGTQESYRSYLPSAAPSASPSVSPTDEALESGFATPEPTESQ